MNEINQVYMKNREEWRQWLQDHYQSEKEVWLVYYKKHSGNPSVAYVDAVEEALCFGWIDGLTKSIDEQRYRQRFTPRKPSSNWSVINIDRAKKMISEGKMTSWGLQIFEEGMKNNRIIPSSKDFLIPPYLKNALEENDEAWSNFQSFAPSAQLAFVNWVTSAKTDKTRQKRIEETVKLSAEGKKLTGL